MECAHPPDVIHCSACADVHCHGQSPVNAANRRTSRARPSISGTVSRRADCCRDQPSSIASNSAGSGRSGTAPSTSTRAADPAAFRIPDTSTPRQTRTNGTHPGNPAQTDQLPHPVS